MTKEKNSDVLLKSVDDIIHQKRKKTEQLHTLHPKSHPPKFQSKSQMLTKPNWKQLKKQYKEKRDSRKQMDNPIYTLSVQAKQVWEEVRQDSCSQERRQQLCDNLYKLIKGHVRKLVVAHDTARVVECLTSHGGPQIRTALFNELKSSILELAKLKYSKFFVLKFLKHGTKDQRDFIISQFYGNVTDLLKHKIAAEVLENAFNDWSNAKQRSQLLQEFYGREYRLFKDDSFKNFSLFLEQHPEKRKLSLQFMRESLQRVLDKGTYSYNIVHTLLHEYLTHADVTESGTMVDQIQEGVVQMIHTKEGARVGMFCLRHGTAKNRRWILRSFKKSVVKISVDPCGYLVMMAVFDSVDDTVFINKVILSELMSGIEELVGSEHGRRILFYLLAGRNTQYLHPDIIHTLEADQGNSKKDPVVRQKELLQLVSGPLLLSVNKYMEEWMRKPNLTVLITAIITHCKGPELKEVYEHLSRFLCNEESSLVEDGAVHQMMKKILHHDKIRQENNEDSFGEVLCHQITEDVVKRWIQSNRGAFMFVFLLETEIPTVIDSVKIILKKQKKELKKKTTKGAKILLQKLH